jgi:hypothetical protein
MVAEPDPGPGSALRVVATVANEGEAELLEQRLAESGIQATSKHVIGGPAQRVGPRGFHSTSALRSSFSSVVRA